MYRLSVIVPFYNSAGTISGAIHSIEKALANLAGPELEIQIIFVDNNSTDGSASIVEEYCAGRSYAKLCCESLQGVSNARNCGLDSADGEYIAFVDSDDTISDDYFITLNRALRSDPNLIVAPLGVKPAVPEIEIVPVGKALRRIKGWWNWQFIFRKSLASGLAFKGECYEDFGFFPLLMERCESITIVNKPIYHYSAATGSLTTRTLEWRLLQLESLFTERNFLGFNGKPEIRRRLLEDYFVLKAHLRAIICIWPVISPSDISLYATKAPLSFLSRAPFFLYASLSIAKRRCVKSNSN